MPASETRSRPGRDRAGAERRLSSAAANRISTWAARTGARADRRRANETTFRGLLLPGPGAGAVPRGQRPLLFRCECSRLDCSALVRLTAVQYRALRREATRFVVTPGHECDDADVVVGRADSHLVVECAPSEIYLG